MIFDISQEIFSSDVYPGDTKPDKKEILSLNKSNPDKCNLTELVLGSHTGTHIDAPCHFVADGKDIEHVELNKCIGKCLVVALEEELCHQNIEQWKKQGVHRVLFKNEKKLTIQDAEYLVKAGCECVGVECSTVGVDTQNEEVHKILLSNEIVIIEGLRMEHVPEGEYFISALPLKMKDLDGSPIRAILWKNDMERELACD